MYRLYFKVMVFKVEALVLLWTTRGQQDEEKCQNLEKSWPSEIDMCVTSYVKYRFTTLHKFVNVFCSSVKWIFRASH